jgi:hypothetical protein
MGYGSLTVPPLPSFGYIFTPNRQLFRSLLYIKDCADLRRAVSATPYHHHPLFPTPIPPPFCALSDTPLIGMPAMATSSQSPAGNHQRSQPTSHGLVSPSSSPQSATPVNTAPVVSKRPSVKLKAVGGKSNILNSAVVNAAGQSLYSISSDSKRTTVAACKDNVKVATVEWNRSSPRMTFRRKKMKCKEWLPFARPDRPDTEYKRPSLPSCGHSESDTARARILTHGDSQLIWMNKSSTSGYVSICHY